MLSYNWDSQELVKKVFNKLVDGGIPCWMDIEGGMDKGKGDLMTAMSEAVQDSAAIIPFCTEKYQNSKICKAELSYAFDENIPILPVICDDGYSEKQPRGEKKDAKKWPCCWLGISIAGNIYVDFREDKDFDSSFEKLVKNIETKTRMKWKIGSSPNPTDQHAQFSKNFSVLVPGSSRVGHMMGFVNMLMSYHDMT